MDNSVLKIIYPLFVKPADQTVAMEHMLAITDPYLLMVLDIL